MKEEAALQNCVRCGLPVKVHRDDYHTFEKMHWLCFHLEFEHEGDPDEPCQDPGCPQWHLKVYRERLQSLGCDPKQVIEDAIKQRWKL